MLEPCLHNETDRGRVSFLEGPPPAQELANIKDRFGTFSFPNVFRNQKLPDIGRRVPLHITPPRTPPVDYATAVSKGPTAALSTQSSSSASRGNAFDKVLQNAQGQRVDSPLNYTQHDFANLKSRKLCNSFHLLGRCRFVEKNGACTHKHGEGLNQKHMAALRAIARQSCCWSGLNCRDSDCILGHRCTRASCVPATCRFSPEMHQVDTKTVG